MINGRLPLHFHKTCYKNKSNNKRRKLLKSVGCGLIAAGSLAWTKFAPAYPLALVTGFLKAILNLAKITDIWLDERLRTYV